MSIVNKLPPPLSQIDDIPHTMVRTSLSDFNWLVSNPIGSTEDMSGHMNICTLMSMYSLALKSDQKYLLYLMYHTIDKQLLTLVTFREKGLRDSFGTVFSPFLEAYSYSVFLPETPFLYTSNGIDIGEVLKRASREGSRAKRVRIILPDFKTAKDMVL